MAPERLQFKGRFLMKFLAEELHRAREEAFRSAMHGDRGDVFESIYSKYEIIPLTIHEDAIQRSETSGYFTDPYKTASSSGEDVMRTPCSVTEFRIPFEGDERLFDFTTHPMPFNPYGRVEDGMFIISVKDGDESHTSDLRYNLNRLRDCIGRVAESVNVYNGNLREIVGAFAPKDDASIRKKMTAERCGRS